MILRTLAQFAVVAVLGILVLFILVNCGGVGFFGEVPVYLALGWTFFLARVIPQVHPNPDEVAVGVVSFLVLLGGFHWFARWVYAGWYASDEYAPVWPWRWTFRVVGVLVLMFVCGTAAIGITHQTVWLFTSPEPIVRWSRGSAHPRSISMNNLKQLGLGAQNFHDQFERFPAPTFTPDGRPLHSWHTAILPFIEQDAIYRKLRLDVPWNDPANKEAVGERVRLFLNPGVPGAQVGEQPITHYAPNVRLFDKPRKLSDFPAGTSVTMLAGEAVRDPKPWADPLNWRDPNLGPTHPAGFSGPWEKNRTLVLFLDGHVAAVDPAGWAKMLRGEVPD